MVKYQLGQRGSLLDTDKTRGTHNHLNETIHKIKREMKNKKQSEVINNNKIVAGITLGFWNSLFFKDEFVALGEDIIMIAPKIPIPPNKNSAFYIKKYKRTQFSNRLNLITTYRNKIAHHNQIILASDNTFYLKPLTLLEKYINELTQYMGESIDVYTPTLKLIKQQKTRLGDIVR